MFVAAACPAERGRGLGLGWLAKPFSEGELLTAAAGAVLQGRAPRHVPPALRLYAR